MSGSRPVSAAASQHFENLLAFETSEVPAVLVRRSQHHCFYVRLRHSRRLSTTCTIPILHDDATLHTILQLAHVPRPGVRAHRPQNVRFNRGRHNTVLAAELLAEMTNEQWNIAGSFAQPRDGDRKNIEPIVQIL